MPVLELFGRIISGRQVEGWMRDTLKLWFGTYLREIERQEGLTLQSLPKPRSYTIAEDADKEPEDQLPAIVVVSPGLNGIPPTADGEGWYESNWRVGVGVFASATDRQATINLVRMYCAVVRALVLQKQSLGGHTDGIEWLDEDYDVMEFDDGRTIGAGQVIFDVRINHAVRKHGGPDQPDEGVPGDWPLVDTVIIDESNVGVQPPVDPIVEDDIITPVPDENDPDYPYVVKNKS